MEKYLGRAALLAALLNACLHNGAALRDHIKQA
jgi:hypothetical protein